VPFPMSINGSIALARPSFAKDVSQVTTKAIILVLKEAYVPSVSVDGASVVFDTNWIGPPLVWSQMRFLRGAITVREESNGVVVDYHLRTTRLVLLATAQSVILAALPMVFVNQHWSVTLPVFGFFWVFLCGGTYLGMVFSFPRWLLRRLKGKVLFGTGKEQSLQAVSHSSA